MDGIDRTSRRPLAAPALAAACALALAAPATGRAAVIKVGSDLSRSASQAEAHGADTAFWNVRGTRYATRVPASGQITELRLKGIAVPSDRPGAPAPLTEFHFQVLHPNPDGSVGVSLSTNPFHIPAGGNPNQVSTYTPDGYLCARAGDYVDFNDEGGFVPDYYPNGVPYQVFAPSSGSVTNWFSRDNGTNIGAVFSGSALGGKELLLQAVLRTGADASPVCGGRKGKVFHGVQIKKTGVTVRRGFAPVRVTCPGVAQGRCEGTLTLTAKGASVGSIGLSVKPTTTINLHVPLTKAGRRLLRKAKHLRVTASASTRDVAGGRARTSARLMLKYAG